jgi:hypothetical protein
MMNDEKLKLFYEWIRSEIICASKREHDAADNGHYTLAIIESARVDVLTEVRAQLEIANEQGETPLPFF